MNGKGALALIGKSLFTYTSSAGFFWTLSLGWMMGPVIYLFVWLVAAGQGDIGGFSPPDFVFYYISLILVNQLTYPSSHWTIGESIQTGALSTWLLRPIPVIYEAIASDLALKIVCFPFVLVVTTILAFLLDFSVVLEGTRVSVFIGLLVLAQVLRFTMAYNLALLALWTQEISALLKIQDTLVFLFAGQVVPTPLLPGFLQPLATVLPFRYMLGFPIEYLMGKLTLAQFQLGLAYQIGWVIIVLLAHKFIWELGTKKYTAVGG